MEHVIEISDLCVRFGAGTGAVDALRGLNLNVARGSVVGFLGPNGAGKTTTIHILLGFISPTSGSARIFGSDTGSSMARERIGYLPEHPTTYGFLSGRELLTMAGRLFRMERSRLKDAIVQVLAKVDMTGAADRRIATYSRGMMQRIGLAQALINDPDLVILDEPTSGLDPIGRAAIRKIIADLKAAGKTVFFSSHELSEVELVCDHVAIMCRGALVAQGPVSSLVGPGQSLEKYFLRVVTAEKQVAASGSPAAGQA
ncbi:MAG: ABC transporter ATP-binding protein [bacterium]